MTMAVFDDLIKSLVGGSGLFGGEEMTYLTSFENSE